MINISANPKRDNTQEYRVIPVTTRNLWFLERSLPLFGILDYFPSEVIGPPETNATSKIADSAVKLTVETDQGWSFQTDITADSKVFRNRSRNRGTGKWVIQAQLKPGDNIVIQKIDRYRFFLSKQTIAAGENND